MKERVPTSRRRWLLFVSALSLALDANAQDDAARQAAGARLTAALRKTADAEVGGFSMACHVIAGEPHDFDDTGISFEAQGNWSGDLQYFVFPGPQRPALLRRGNRMIARDRDRD